MKTKTLVAALAGLVGLWADAGELKANGCFARWDETTLTVGNGCFTRIYGCAGEDLKTRSFVAYGSEWIDSARVDKTGAKMSVAAEAARRGPVGADGLKVVVTAGAKTRTLWLFASVPGVILEDPSVIDLSKWKPDERLYNNVYRKLPYYLAGADRLHLKPRHVLAREFELRDMTDIRNELVEENTWLLMTREEPLLRSVPVVSVEETFASRGLVFLRLAPLPNDRPVVLPDFSFAASEDWSKPNQVYLASVANGYPVAELAYEGGEAGRTRALHALQRALRPYRAGRDGMFLTNTWGDGHRDARINADFMMAEVKAGGELGVDVIQIDDGWQSGKSHNSALIKSRKEGVWGNFRAGNPNFWKPDPEKFPGGLGPIVAAAKERGMGFGLWFGPDKTDDYADWELDATTLVDFYRAYGIRYFKIDGIIMNSDAGFANIRRFFDRMLVDSNGEMTFDLDVTGAAKRPAYFGLPDIGPLFMENRYIGGEGAGKGGLYWPHFTLRNVWTLAKLIDPVRLRAEICNPLRGQAAFGDDPLAPKFWRGDTLFASVMVTSPLGWFEISELDPKTVAEMKPLVATWKRERANLHGGETLPVGAAPDGLAWTGFATCGADGKSAYALLFRELSAADTFALDLGVFGNARFSRAEVIGGRGTANLSGGALQVKVPAKLDFVWVKLTDAPAVARNIDVSKDCPRYFVDAAGKAFVPIGINLVSLGRGKDAAASEQKVKEYERWLDAFAANGGNWIRIWLSAGQFEVMPEKAGVFDPAADAVIRRIVARCEKLGIRIKYTLVHHRSFFPKNSEARQPWANCTVYSPFVRWWGEFYKDERCNRFFFDRIDHLKSLGLADSPASACWEPCNEISASAYVNDYAPWSDMVLARLQETFPRQMVTQNLGSYSSPAAYRQYQQMAGVNANAFMQIHRYLDPGAQIDVCRGPLDVLAAESVREMLEMRPDRPAVLAETGAVEANHAGPSALYGIDTKGVMMHDLLFAPFFAGGAGCGQLWHWDVYVDRNGLWHHFRRFAKAIEGLDPVAEDFRPFRTETPRLRVYGLRGKKTTVVWCRDKASDWRTELGQRIAPSVVKGERLPFDKTDFTYYLPWEDRTVTSKEPVLPDFTRSVVARFPTDLAYAHIIEPH